MVAHFCATLGTVTRAYELKLNALPNQCATSSTQKVYRSEEEEHMAMGSLVRRLLLLACVCGVADSSAKGAVALDTLTFDKIIAAHDIVLVKFDKQYPYGDNEKQFETFAQRGATNKALLVAEVGVSEYGEKENEALKERFSVNKEDYPVYKLFLKGKAVEYSGDKSADDLTRFVKQEAGLWIGLPGCLEQFDELAGRFMSAGEHRQQVIEEAQKAADAEEDKKTAGLYVKLMGKIVEKGDGYVESETKRVKGLAEGRISKEKKDMFKLRLNILSSFQVTASGSKEEL
eukprot:m.307205 g.307205  ORF g.307205 m.307205 type:complete len:288 (+) comp42017_c0_seq1:877-1740(+)